MSIGWFGVPGKTPRDPKVHVVRNGQAVCGTLFAPESQYQECAGENERTLHMVECRRCRRIVGLQAALYAQAGRQGAGAGASPEKAIPGTDGLQGREGASTGFEAGVTS